MVYTLLNLKHALNNEMRALRIAMVIVLVNLPTGIHDLVVEVEMHDYANKQSYILSLIHSLLSSCNYG
jgi:hypothetical protein